MLLYGTVKMNKVVIKILHLLFLQVVWLHKPC